jgi:hypothetical protein
MTHDGKLPSKSSLAGKGKEEPLKKGAAPPRKEPFGVACGRTGYPSAQKKKKKSKKKKV